MENLNNSQVNNFNVEAKKVWSEPALDLISKNEVQTGNTAGVEAGVVYQS